jgi:hypothetical protein
VEVRCCGEDGLTEATSKESDVAGVCPNAAPARRRRSNLVMLIN